MTLQSSEITIPNIKLTIDQLLTTIRQLDKPTRVQIARVLVETEMDSKLANLIEQLAKTSPVKDISNAEIDAEVKAVRQSNR